MIINTSVIYVKCRYFTGSSSGIGFGTAVHFAKLGAKLVLTGRNEKGLTDAKKECIKAGASEKDVRFVLNLSAH